MAYTGIDKEIYESGTHFRPMQKYTQQQWTPPAIMGQNTNTGITATQAAGSYMGYPSYEAWLLAQGGGGGNGGGNEIEEDTFSMGMSPGAMGGKLPGFGNWAKRTAGTLGHMYSQLPTPTHLLRRGWKGIQKWRGDRKIAEEKRVADEIAAHNKAAAEQAAAHTRAQGRYEASVAGGREGGGWYGGADYSGGKSGDVAQAGPGRDPDDRMAQGGRIGYRKGGDDEDNLTTLEFMQDQNIPYGEMVSAEGIPFMWEEFLAAKELDPGLTYEIFLNAIDRSPWDETSTQDQGIARLV